MKKIFALIITVILFAFALCASASAADKIAMPKKLKATPTSTSVSLKWSKSEGADYYRIYYKTSKDGKWKTALKKTTKTKHTFEKLPSGKKYYFAVRSFDKTNDGTLKSDLKVVKIATKPMKTKKITATAKIKRVQLKWSKVKGATHYRVYQKINGEWKSHKLTKKTSLTVKELKPETSYSFAVRAYVKSKSYTVAGERNSASVMTKAVVTNNPAVPEEPLGKYVTTTDGGIKLYEITSTEAKAAYNKWAFVAFDYYEGKNKDGIIIIYSKDSGEWLGVDLAGATYNFKGETSHCEYCGKISGRGINMCNGCINYME